MMIDISNDDRYIEDDVEELLFGILLKYRPSLWERDKRVRPYLKSRSLSVGEGEGG